MNKTKVSFLIPTFNEERNIKCTLDSVNWADEVFIIDSFSTDRCLEIAKKYPNVKIYQHKFENYANQKNWALDNLPFSNEWVFILDADERITSELRDEIKNIVQTPNNKTNGYYANRRFIFLGKWIKHCGWYPSWNLRLFKQGKARYEKRTVNEHMIVDGSVGFLKNDMIHENHKGIKDWIAKHNRYSSFEIEEIYFKGRDKFKGNFFGNPIERRRFLKNLFYKLPFRPFLRFFYMYFLKLGFLDGSMGFIYCVLKAIQEFHINVKLKEVKLKNKR